ncbi:MAG: hypothetical protein FH748_01815 [Balneolaceae bacterium]|nr:hypothetical protein [Balneolaceae bacterium]
MKYGFLYIVSFVLVVAGCNRSPMNQDHQLAQVGNSVLYKAEAKANIPSHIFEADSISAYHNYRDDWIRREIVLQEAERINFTNQQNVQAQLKRIQDEYILQAVQDYIIAQHDNDITITDEEARSYYQQNKDKFTLNERYVRYRHLSAGSRSDAQNARQELLAGIPWPEVAQKYGINPELNIQESERFWPISVAGGEIEQLSIYLNIIGISEISPIHREGNNYHFVQLMEERPKGAHPELDWLIEEIKQWLLLEKRKRAFNSYVKNLYLQGQANNEIKIFNVLNGNTKSVSDSILSNTISNEE